MNRTKTKRKYLKLNSIRWFIPPFYYYQNDLLNVYLFCPTKAHGNIISENLRVDMILSIYSLHHPDSTVYNIHKFCMYIDSHKQFLSSEWNSCNSAGDKKEHYRHRINHWTNQHWYVSHICILANWIYIPMEMKMSYLLLVYYRIDFKDLINIHKR